jgi:hypothetical protein
LALNEVREVSEALVQTPQDVGHESPIADRFAEIGKLVGGHLQAAAIFNDTEITLHNGAELGVKGHGPSLSIAEELALETKPDEAGGRRSVGTI